MCINHWADSANLKGIAFNKIYSGLTGKCFEMPNASYTNVMRKQVLIREYILRHQQSKVTSECSYLQTKRYFKTCTL